MQQLSLICTNFTNDDEHVPSYRQWTMNIYQAIVMDDEHLPSYRHG
jgi:hypothetical protein